MAGRNIPIVALSAPEEDLRAAKKEWSARLLQPKVQGAFRAFAAAPSPQPAENVVGVGIGEKYAGSEPTGILALKFLVRRKYPEDRLTRREKLPKEVDGLPVDVEEVGTLRRFAPTAAAKKVTMPNPRTRIRPAQPGSSVGFVSTEFEMAGTFGAVVQDGEGRRYVLSNNHVLADENRLPIGSPILQPGTLDGGRPATDQIASLTRFVPLQPGVPNYVDAAIAQATDPGILSPAILYIGPPAGEAAAELDMPVHKFGRTTSYTVGQVTSIATDVTVEYEVGVVLFEDQIIIVGRNGKAFGAGGDSGSLILERGTNLAVGLLFAGSASHIVANHLSRVLQDLGVTLTT